MIKFKTDPEFFQSFYKSLCGRVTSKTINQHILSLWPEVKNMNVLVIGWGFPYIHHFQNDSNRVICVSPHHTSKNIDKIPKQYKNVTTLAKINHLPFSNHFFDRILVIHGGEYSTDIIDFLNNIEQLLNDDGRFIVVMPNRSGIWRTNKKTPFKHGAAITAGQLEWSLKHVGFDIDYYSAALAFPPTNSRALLSIFTKWEGIGRNIFPFFSGVHILEGHKNLYTGAIRKPIAQKFTLNSPALKAITE